MVYVQKQKRRRGEDKEETGIGDKWRERKDDEMEKVKKE